MFPLYTVATHIIYKKKYRLILHTDKCPHDIEKLMFIAYN